MNETAIIIENGSCGFIRNGGCSAISFDTTVTEKYYYR